MSNVTLPNSIANPPGVFIKDSISTQVYSLNMGPQHPSTHGVYRVVLTIDGEVIQKAENMIGYLHRGMEKLAESRTYTQFIPYTDRLDYLAAVLNNLGYVQTIEKLLPIEIPERAQYLRIIISELQRVASHLVYIASFGLDLSSITGWMYAFADREKILDLFEMTFGGRLTNNYIRVGGVSNDIPEEFLPALRQFLDGFQQRLDDFDKLLTYNQIFIGRTKGIGIISSEMALNYGLTGPNLRASGVDFDLRKKQPYGIYDRFDFSVPVLTAGDSLARYHLRLLEIQQSIRIIEQAVKGLPSGPVKAKVPAIIKLPPGEIFYQTEGAKGLLGYYLVSDGGTKPYRLHIHAPSFVNIGIIPEVIRGLTIQDFVSFIASIDLVLGEVDR